VLTFGYFSLVMRTGNKSRVLQNHDEMSTLPGVAKRRSRVDALGRMLPGDRGIVAVTIPQVETRFRQFIVFVMGALMVGCGSSGAQNPPPTILMIAPSPSPAIYPSSLPPSPSPATPATLTPLSPTPFSPTPLPPTPTLTPTPTDSWPPENWLFPDSEVV
jgi:hypothetical protein